MKPILPIISSKSQTMRALLFAAFAKGMSVIHKPLNSPDVEAMIEGISILGAIVKNKKKYIRVKGIGKKAKSNPSQAIIDARNSGQVLRFLGALSALGEREYILTGDHSIKTNRPILPLVSALQALGAKVRYLEKKHHPPLAIQGPICSGEIRMDGRDSQPVSAILMACSFLQGISTIYAENSGEKPWIDLTLYWLEKLGAKIINENYRKYTIFGNLNYNGFTYTVPGDFSSAAFPLVYAIITKSHLILENLDFTDPQGDKKFIDVLQDMGADLSKDQIGKRLIVKPCQELKGGILDVNDIIDAVPILAVLGCFCKTPLELRNCQIARKKESNRLEAITCELKKMGAKIECAYDKLKISPSALFSAKVKSYGDHRIAMALAVASFTLKDKTCEIKDTKCIEKTYPNFFEEMKKIKK